METKVKKPSHQAGKERKDNKRGRCGRHRQYTTGSNPTPALLTKIGRILCKYLEFYVHLLLVLDSPPNARRSLRLRVSRSKRSRVYMNATDLSTGTYFVKAYTTGYVQRETYTFSITTGSTGDLVVDLVRGAKLSILINFKTEDLFASIDTYPYNPTFIPVRVEIYDSLGTFVAANVSHIPGTTAFQIDVVGFNSYAGNPAYRWTNYYDTTDSKLQKDYGLASSTYLVYGWVPGYIQRSVVTATVDPGGAATVIFDLHRLSHVYGQATGYNMFGEVIPISWATISAYGPTLMATSSSDGFYEIWLENGTYTLAAFLVGYETQATEVYASMGSEVEMNFTLKPLGAPIPELSATELTLLAILIIAYTLLHRKEFPYSKHNILTSKSEFRKSSKEVAREG